MMRRAQRRNFGVPLKNYIFDTTQSAVDRVERITALIRNWSRSHNPHEADGCIAYHSASHPLCEYAYPRMERFSCSGKQVCKLQELLGFDPRFMNSSGEGDEETRIP